VLQKAGWALPRPFLYLQYFSPTIKKKGKTGKMKEGEIMNGRKDWTKRMWAKTETD
jgi:hypothetical protein